MVEERESEREVLVVEVVGVSDKVLTARFRNPTKGLNRATARRLIYKVVLEDLLRGRFKSCASIINYVDVDAGVATAMPYAWPG